jgi:putative ABC transport system permease protein
VKNNKQAQPPRWAQRFLEWYCRPELLEDLQGDLNEYFERHCRNKSARRAKLIYVSDVIKFFRPYTVRKPDFINLLIHWFMLGSYVKTSSRSIVRNKLFSAINIIGLSVSMSVGLLLIAMLTDMNSYDSFHTHHSRIYRVISRREFLGKENDFMATSSLRAAKAIKETVAGPEEVTVLRRGFKGDVVFGENTLPLTGFWASESLFKVFTFPLLQGNATTALKNPFSVVLTETTAKKIFGNEDAIGKTLILNKNKSYTITGILQDVPKFSHMQFEMLGSLSTREILEKENPAEMKWDNIWNAWTYLLLPENVDPAYIKTNLDQLSVREDPSVENTHIELALQPLDEIMTGDNWGNQIGATLGRTVIMVFTALTLVVILSACFNYTNLSVARSLRRSREVGIRKVIGARKSHVVWQFVVEAVIISLLSLSVAFVLFLLLRPHFLSIQPDLQKLLLLNLSPALVIYFVLFAIVIGVAAGFFPALFFARINTIQVLKDISTVRMFRKVTMRKVLIVFQYSISIMLITGTLIIYQQYKHYVAFDLGFSTENILNIKLHGNKAELLKKELNELTEVKDISQTVLITGVGNYWGATVKNPKNPEDSAFIYSSIVDERYIPLHEHQLLAGSNFTPHADSAVESEVIVNLEVLKRFNLAQQNPALALGEVLNINGKELKIIGVMKDFQYGKATNAMAKEVMLRYSKSEAEFLNVKIISPDLQATYAKIQSIWKKMDTVHPFDAKFYDDEIEEAFSGFTASIKLAGFVAFLAICIATMGLLGMVVFTTETRLKEISIRKILGAGEGRLIYLLGNGFILLLIIAASIALPLTYFFFDKIVFQQMANHQPLSFVQGFMGVSAVLIIAILLIGWQTLKAARRNPAEVLKNE